MGSTTCQSGGCTTTSLGKAADGSFTANYGTNDLILSRAGISSADSTGRRRLSAGRALQSDSPAITNPVICVKIGAVILFDVNPDQQQYPVYLKDSTLNTNQEFDRAPFDQLAGNMQAGEKVYVFSFEFTQAGTYVFGDSNDSTKMTVIGVKARDESCPDAANI
jgi:hypothetical protein